MSARPAIPVALRRRVFVEAGHRCAVCCAIDPLQIAHIVPWSTVREHRFENLLLMCANCHGLADRKPWAPADFRAYKKLPCVTKTAMKMIQSDGPKTTITLKFNEPPENFDAERKERLEQAASAYLGIPPNRLRITGVDPGSALVRMEVPSELADKLCQAYKRRDERLMTLIYAEDMIATVEMFPEAEAETVRPPEKSGPSVWDLIFRDFAGPILTLAAFVFGTFSLSLPTSLSSGHLFPNGAFQFSMLVVAGFAGFLGWSRIAPASIITATLGRRMATVLFAVEVVWYLVGHNLAFESGAQFVGRPGPYDFGPAGSIIPFGLEMVAASTALLLCLSPYWMRMKFSALVFFALFWVPFVYAPITHMTRGPGGLLNGAEANAGIQAFDATGVFGIFAAGSVASYILLFVLGPSTASERAHAADARWPELRPTTLVWFGCAALALGHLSWDADELGHTFLLAASASAVPGLLHWVLSKRCRLEPFLFGLLGSLGPIAAGGGSFSTGGAIAAGCIAGFVADLSDVRFSTVVGTEYSGRLVMLMLVTSGMGSMLPAMFLAREGRPQLPAQAGAYFVTVAWAAAGTYVIALFIKAMIGLRPANEVVVAEDEARGGYTAAAQP